MIAASASSASSSQNRAMPYGNCTEHIKFYLGHQHASARWVTGGYTYE